MQGRIMKGISGFFYVYVEGSGMITCKAKGILSFKGGKPDQGDMLSMGTNGETKLNELTTEDNYFFSGTKPTNSKGQSLSEDIFVSTDTKNFKPKRKADGSIDMQGVLELNDKAPKNAGARF